MDYVMDIRSDEVQVQCESTLLRKELALAGVLVGDVALVPIADRSDLARVLTWLQKLGVPFLDAGPGWTPADVFKLMRSDALVAGPITGIYWTAPGSSYLREV
jgi:hypothetical protein